MKTGYQCFFAAFFTIFCLFGCGMDSEYDLKDVRTKIVDTNQDQVENPAVIPAYRPNDDNQLQSEFQNRQDNTAFLTCRGVTARRDGGRFVRRLKLTVACEMIDGRIAESSSISSQWGLNDDGDIANFNSTFPRPIIGCSTTLTGGVGTPIVLTALCPDIYGNFRINTFELHGTNINGLIINPRLVRA